LEVPYETAILYPFAHLSFAGIERLRNHHDQSIANAQPYYSAGDLPAKENDQMMKKLILTVLIVLTTLTLAACAPSVTSLSPEEGAAYAAEVDEYVESYLVGLSECDFATHTRGFDPETWEGHLDESAWQQDCEADRGVYGAYQSTTLDHVEERPGIRARVAIYHVVFENDPDRTLEVYFGSDDPDHLIIGVSFLD
jgi:hypothetical protein